MTIKSLFEKYASCILNHTNRASQIDEVREDITYLIGSASGDTRYSVIHETIYDMPANMRRGIGRDCFWVDC